MEFQISECFLKIFLWLVIHEIILSLYFFLLWFRCHGPRPPPNPDFTLRPKKKKPNHQSESTPGTPCPPCPELVWRPCLGQHIGAERMVCFNYLVAQWIFFFFSFLYVGWLTYFGCSSFQMVCSNRTQFSCENLCGSPLSCGNHYCTKTCHALKSQSSTSLVQHKRSESCEECHLPCEKVINYCDAILLFSIWFFLLPIFFIHFKFFLVLGLEDD
jgi:hypothetical protein